MTAFCTKQGFAYFGKNECVEKAEIVKNHYPEAFVPVFNYPSVWPRIYGLFADNTEQFFKKFWALNTTLLVIGTLLLSLKYNYLLFPFVLFNPITLLTIERGNIEASTFFLTFVPLLLLPQGSKWLQGFFLGIATAAKVFPLFGYLSLISPRKPFVQKGLIFGALLSAPIALYSLSEIRHMADGTTKGFGVAYGLASINYGPYIINHPRMATALMLAYVVASLTLITVLLRRESLTKSTDSEILLLQAKDLILLKASLIIFVCTFLVFTNWAYRLIFLIPAFFILSNQKSVACKIAFWNIFAIFWFPIIPYGWNFQNLACYTLAISGIFLLIRIFRVESVLQKSST
jgi:hypothetical protein